MTTKKKDESEGIVAPETNDQQSSDATNWSYKPASGDFPEGDGPHVEQVFDGIQPAKD